MKCINCDYCKKGWYKVEPEKYACIGVKHPFIIRDVNSECTEYPEKRDIFCETATVTAQITPAEPVKAHVDDYGIWVPSTVDIRCSTLLISKELFVEAYNKWIKGE